MGVIISVLCPVTVNVYVVPLLLIALVVLSGKLVSGLQKEI